MSFTELVKEGKPRRLLHDKSVFLRSKARQPLLPRGDNAGQLPVTLRRGRPARPRQLHSGTRGWRGDGRPHILVPVPVLIPVPVLVPVPTLIPVSVPLPVPVPAPLTARSRRAAAAVTRGPLAAAPPVALPLELPARCLSKTFPAALAAPPGRGENPPGGNRPRSALRKHREGRRGQRERRR